MQGTFGCFSQCRVCWWSALDARFNRREQIGSICFYIVRILALCGLFSSFSSLTKQFNGSSNYSLLRDFELDDIKEYIVFSLGCFLLLLNLLIASYIKLPNCSITQVLNSLM